MFTNTQISLGGTWRSSKTAKMNPSSQYDLYHFFRILDQCTQILREDRLWLRNQLKEGNQDLMRIFLSNSEATSPLPSIDIRTLQINLRKYITMIKQKNKAEQIVKFKQNMQLLEFTKSKQRQQKNYRLKDNSQTKEKIMKTYSQQNRNQRDKSTKSLIYPYRLNEKKIIKIQNQIEQSNSRSFKGKYSLKKQKETSEKKRVVKQAKKKKEACNSRFIYSRWKRPDNPKETALKFLQNALDENFKQPCQFQRVSEKPHLSSISAEKNSVIEHNSIEEGSYQNYLQSNQFPHFPEEQTSQMIKIQNNEQFLASQNQNTFINQSLYTSEDLLKQCRMYISRKKDLDENEIQEQKEQNEQIEQNIERPYLKSIHENSMKEKLEKASDRILKDTEQQPKTLIVERILEKVIEKNGWDKIHVSKLFPVLQSFSGTLYSEVSNFLSSLSWDWISIGQLGRLLNDTVQSDPTNQAAYIYGLIDVEAKGFVSSEDFSDFLKQLVEAGVEETVPLQKALWNFFNACEAADWDGKGQKFLDYWSFYAMQYQVSFQQVCELLQPYQFQIQA